LQEVFDAFVLDDDFTIAQMPKIGKGRPKKITAQAEPVQIQQPIREVILPEPGRGRPRKITSAPNDQPIQPIVIPESTISKNLGGNDGNA
jgi:hypothetical protein